MLGLLIKKQYKIKRMILVVLSILMTLIGLILSLLK